MTNPISLDLDISVKKNHFELHAQCQIDWAKPGIHVIFGSSGCGKTHLLKAIAGLEKSVGRINFQEETWLDSQQQVSIPCHLRDVGVVFQDSQLFSHLNVLGNLQFSFKRSDASQDDWDHVIEALNLQLLLNKKTQQLSGGEKQRVSLGRSLLSKPALLLMDEPLASLDWHSKQEIMPYIQQVCEQWQLPILYVTHSLDEVMQLADQVILLNKKEGKSHIEKIGPLMDLLQDVQQGFNRAAKAGSIIHGTLLQSNTDRSQTDKSKDLNQIQLNNQILYTAKQNNLKAGPIRLRIQANDVSLCLSKAEDSSIINILPAEITDITAQENDQCLIKLNLDGQSLLSRISRHSLERLKLEKGQTVYAQIKAVALQQSLNE